MKLLFLWNLIFLLPFISVSLLTRWFMIWAEAGRENVIFGASIPVELRWPNQEFHRQIEPIIRRIRRRCWQTLAAEAVLVLLICLLPRMFLAEIFWMLLIFLDMFLTFFLYGCGNRTIRRIKTLYKKEENRPQIVYADLTNSGRVHGLHPLPFAGVLLVNLILTICLGKSQPDLKPAFWILMGCQCLIALLFFFMDRLRNRVISADSAVNANYNRARKKVMAKAMLELMILSTCLPLAIGAAYTVNQGNLRLGEFASIAGFIAYFLLVILVIALLAYRMYQIDRKYQGQMFLGDDDDAHWIWGMFYYNPKDSRNMVEKRVGIGSTMNLARPAGKWAMAFLGLVIAAVFVFLGFFAVEETLPMRAQVQEDEVICRQLIVNERIRKTDVRDTELLEQMPEPIVRTNGSATDEYLKGTFRVGQEKGCQLFVRRDARVILRIRTDQKTYYITGENDRLTEELYGQLQ